MVDVTDKAESYRVAEATATIIMSRETIELIQSNGHKKGDVISVARVAGIMAAKKCADIIPLCHPLNLTSVKLYFEVDSKQNAVHIRSVCKLTGQTGVEMEALTAANVAALTLFDMCKAVDKKMVITGVHVLSKSGGKSGDWKFHE